MALPLSLTIFTLLRLLAVSIVIFYIWPRYALVQHRDMAPIDASMLNGVRVLLLLMLAGYALTAAHVFSWLTIVLCLYLLRLTLPRRELSRYQLSSNMRFAARVLVELDDLTRTPKRLWGFMRKDLRQALRAHLRRPGWQTVFSGILFLAVIAVAAIMRFHENFSHADMPFADANVVVGWVKDIASQQLFPNGIYPEGFHIVIAALQKLTITNTYVLVKLMGPLVGVLMVLSVSYTTYRVTGRMAPAIVAAVVYGTLPMLLPYTIDRQAGTDPQEFGNVFVLPVLWFTYMAWARPGTGFRATSICLLAIAALVHPVAAMDAALTAVAAAAAGAVFYGVDRGTLFWYVRYVLLAAFLAIAPLALAYLLGHPLNVGFVAAKGSSLAPPITIEAKVAAASAVALLILRFAKGEPGEAGLCLAALLTLLAALAVQQAARLGLSSLVLGSRGGEFLALSEALCFGLGFSVVEELLAIFSRNGAALAALVLVIPLTGFAWAKEPPAVLHPYRMYQDSLVATYMRIEQTQPKGNWLAVSDDGGYAFALGEGFYTRPSVFLSTVSPNYRWPHYVYNGVKPYSVTQDKIFLFVDRRVVVPKLLPGRNAIIRRRRRQRKEILAWIAKREKRFGSPHINYKGKDLEVYELSRAVTSKQKAREIFGG